MKKLVLAAILATMSTPVFSQTVVIKPEQETVIREYVKTRPVTSVTVPDVKVEVGTKLPDTVEIHTIDAPDISYGYVVVDDRTVVVDPDTREIVRVLD